jgi:hypothetical protein
MPSFASEARRQLAAGAASNPGRADRAELAGLVDAAGVWEGQGVTVRTSSAAVARAAVRLWRSEFGLHSKLSPAGPDRFGRTRYAVRTEGNGALQSADELRFTRASRATADRTSYHRDESFVRRVAAFSRASLNVARRRGRWVAYTKSHDGVTTVLAQMGLNDAVLEYEARAVLGEAKANANRITNFDEANAGRTAKAAARQQKVLEALDPKRLPPALREMLELRLEHPDASLAELARLGGLSKGAANHRLRRLVELAP